jgi:hypothetical protein
LWLSLGIVVDDASLALLVFALSMWVALPWAFVELVNKRVRDKIGELAEKALDGMVALEEKKEEERPKQWLARGTACFMYAGMWFLVQWLFDFANILVIPIPAFFLAGLGFLFWGFFETYRVIQFVLNPDRTDEIYAPITMIRIFSAVLGLAYAYVFVYQLYFRVYAESPLDFVLTASFPISLIGVALIWRIKWREKLVWRRFVPSILFVGLPVWIVVAIVLYYVAQGGRVS